MTDRAVGKTDDITATIETASGSMGDTSGTDGRVETTVVADGNIGEAVDGTVTIRSTTAEYAVTRIQGGNANCTDRVEARYSWTSLPVRSISSSSDYSSLE